jgi:hypothetical protein
MGTALSLVQASAAIADTATSTSAGTNQLSSLSNNYTADSLGSDNSLRSSTVYIMQALIDFNNTRLVSAVKNGYQAYGQYRNAENLDHLKDQTAISANSLGSADSAPIYTSTYTNTTYARLDPSFLRQGTADTISGEFERETGMTREDFLSQLSSISEQKIKRSDPQMIDKALSRLEGFIQKVPNTEFRQNAERNLALVPNSVRRGMISQAVSKLAGFFDTGPANSALNASSITDLASGKLPEVKPGSEITAASSATDNVARKPAATGITQPGVPSASSGKTGAEGAVAAALFTQENGDVTIFQQVTKRYRILTPLLQVSSKSP